MDLLDHLNLYFGTEHETVESFIHDFKNGDLHDDYNNDSEKVNHILRFLLSLDRGNIN